MPLCLAKSELAFFHCVCSVDIYRYVLDFIDHFLVFQVIYSSSSSKNEDALLDGRQLGFVLK